MPDRIVMSRQTALKLAGDRRRQLDRERGEQDKRIEAAAAETLVALQLREDAERALRSAQGKVGELLRRVLAEDVSVKRAAALLDLDVAEIRRLLKAAPSDVDQGCSAQEQGSVTALRQPGGSDEAVGRIN